MIWLTIAALLWLVFRFGHPKLQRYLLNLIILVFDIFPNVVLAGSPYETISERCWRHREHPAAARAVKLIDFLFFTLAGERDHCANADEGPDEGKYEVWG